jgi:hypothetical protein
MPHAFHQRKPQPGAVKAEIRKDTFLSPRRGRCRKKRVGAFSDSVFVTPVELRWLCGTEQRSGDGGGQGGLLPQADQR